MYFVKVQLEVQHVIAHQSNYFVKLLFLFSNFKISFCINKQLKHIHICLVSSYPKESEKKTIFWILLLHFVCNSTKMLYYYFKFYSFAVPQQFIINKVSNKDLIQFIRIIFFVISNIIQYIIIFQRKLAFKNTMITLNSTNCYSQAIFCEKRIEN